MNIDEMKKEIKASVVKQFYDHVTPSILLDKESFERVRAYVDSLEDSVEKELLQTLLYFIRCSFELNQNALLREIISL